MLPAGNERHPRRPGQNSSGCHQFLCHVRQYVLRYPGNWIKCTAGLVKKENILLQNVLRLAGRTLENSNNLLVRYLNN